MTRSRLAALGLAAAVAACGKSSVSAPGVELRQPSAIVAFHGITIANPAIDEYFAIANESRNDLSIVRASNDLPVLAPVAFRTLGVPSDRPAILVSASLGDGEGQADLLVAVAAGDSRLQIVRTWTAANEIVDASTVDAGGEVLAAVALPGLTSGTARIALALSDRRIAIATYKREGAEIVPDGGIPPETLPSKSLKFQPVALAAIPGAGDRIYAATPEPFDPLAVPLVFGVAEIDVGGAAPSFTDRFLDARGPTRLVAAARLRERQASATASDETAFTGQPTVDRVYAVLDESGCGSSQRIDCGVAVIDPCRVAPCQAVNPAGGLLPDLTGRMPYLAPIPLPARPVAFAVSPPPVNGPSGAADDKYRAGGPSGDLMRIWPALGPQATTAVGAVACANGKVYFLDLGRWKVANDVDPLGAGGTRTVSVQASYRDLPPTTPPTAVPDSVRLWITDASGTFESDTTATSRVTATPGYTRSATLTTVYQGVLPSLNRRPAEAGLVSPGSAWLALQQAGGTGGLSGVVSLSDAALGVHVDDVVQIDAAGVPGCVGTSMPGDTANPTQVFEARVASLLAPTGIYPGGAVGLRVPTQDELPDPLPAADTLQRWTTCLDALVSAAASGTLTNLTATFYAGGYVTTSDVDGYVGRPAVPASGPTTTAARSPMLEFKLEYPATGNEDTLAGEALVLARKARRIYHVSEACSAADTACSARWPGLVFPNVAGPVASFRFGVQPKTLDRPVGPVPRGLQLTVVTGSGVSPFAAGTAASQGSLAAPRGITPFDRSVVDPASGYRFLVPYAGNWVLDAAPSADKAAPVAIR